MEFCDYIKQLRESKGHTRSELATIAHIGDKALRDLENGRTTDPKISTLFKLSGALDEPIENLYSYFEHFLSNNNPSKDLDNCEGEQLRLLGEIAATMDDTELAEKITNEPVKEVFGRTSSCLGCGNTNLNKEDKFCNKCGAPIVNVCLNSNCRITLSVDSAYCTKCGSQSLFLKRGLVDSNNPVDDLLF